MSETAVLKAPFPAFGGKSAIAAEVWKRLGDVRNYCEPFAFSAAVLLKRPVNGAIETINDANSYVPNFWRAVKHDPEAVAAAADWLVSEADLHARHNWLVNSSDARMALERVRKEPDYFDAKIAGWWCWGACCWIGSGWCVTQQLPHMDPGGRGIMQSISQQLPMLGGDGSSGGVHSPSGHKRPQLCNGNTMAGPGVLSHIPLGDKRPIITGWSDKGVNSGRPQLADAYSRGRGVNGADEFGTCEARRRFLLDWFGRLSDRLRTVRVCCGHWARICDSPSTLTRLGLTGVFLDPPYRKSIDGKKNRASDIYANDKTQDVNALCDEVQTWCLKWGDDPEIRIALCGYEGEYPEIDKAGWTKWEWKAQGGYGNRTQSGQDNAARERVWFNRACLSGRAVESNLFTALPQAV